MSRQRTRSLVTIAVILALTAALGSATWPVHSQGAPEGTDDAALIESIRRASVASDGTQANFVSSDPSLSADGRYVAFSSYASNLVSGDTNGMEDVFVHDRTTGTTARVSVATDGTQGNSISRVPSLSADGRYVAFSSYASNLVSGDTNGMEDVFVHDVVTGITARISVATDGTQGNSDSYVPSLSADGRYMAFMSYASNLVSGDTNDAFDVFVHDRTTGTTARISVATDGTQGNSDSYVPSLSADGRYVAFMSYASNLVSGDTNDAMDIFVHDRTTGTTTRVSVATDGTQADEYSNAPSLSTDGRYVAFQSSASNLVSGDTNGMGDVFVHDRTTGTTTRVSVASNGTQGNSSSSYPSLSADGRYVAFMSYASNLVSGDTNDAMDIFVHDRTTGTTTRVSVAADGTQGNSGSSYPSLSADGRYVAFQSDASNLVNGDTNNTLDVFIAPTGFAMPDAALSEVTAAPLSAPANGTTSITASVTLRDAFNVPLAGVPVMLSSAPNTVSITPASATTNASGVATFSVTSTSIGSKTLSAVAGGVPLTQTVEVTFLGPDLTLSLTHTGNFSGGVQAAYTLTVSNAADALATSDTITVLSPLPDALSFVSGSGDGFTCALIAPNVQCTRPADPPLAAGASAVITLQVLPQYVTAVTQVTTTASVATGNEVNTSNNTASDPTTIDPVLVSASLSGLNATPSTAPADGITPLTVSVTVREGGDLPVVGAPVTLSSAPNTVSITPASATTNASGVATFSVTSTLAGGKTLSAVAGGVTLTQTAEVTFMHSDTVGVFRPSNGRFYLRHALTTGPANVTAAFGQTDDLPVAGDWDGDGVDTIGIYRNGTFFLKDANTTAAPTVYTFALGNPGDLPMAGDWDGDGKDGVGTFRPTNGRLYLKNALTTGFADFAMVLGINGDRPVAGDWNGDGFDSPGVYRPSNTRFFLTDQRCNCIVFADYQLTFGAVGDVGFAGDWDGDGKSGVGVFRPTNGATYLRNGLTTGFADVSMIYGIANDRPIAGKWQAPSTAPSDAAPEFKPGQ